MTGQDRKQAGNDPAHLPACLRAATIVVPAAMLAVLLARRVWDVDIFWQLKLGELILQNHGPILREPFAALHLGEPLPAVAWAGQAMMAAARTAGGWSLLRVIDALAWLGGFWAVAAACRWRGASTQAVAIALVLTFLTALPTASVRPQSFACLCFGLLLALHRLQLRPGPAVTLGFPLLVAWQNLHPSASVGVAAMALAALPGWAAWLYERSRPLPLTPSVLVLAGVAALFMTPDGLSILKVSAINADASMAIGASEWLPLWLPANHANAVPVLALTLAAVWMGTRSHGRVDAAELATAAGLLVMTVAAYRFVLFWSVAMVPLLARAATTPPGDHATPPPRSHVARSVLAVAVIALAMPLLFPTRFAETLPLAAVQRLRQAEVRGTVYADFPFGGVLIDGGYPDWHVAYDGRYYRYLRDEWRYNGGIENGIVPLVDVVRKWQPAAFLLNARHNAPLAGELAHNPKWRCIWAREGIVIYVPRHR